MNPSDKIVGIGQLLPLVKHWKTIKEKVVFTNGCFDVLHVGHVGLLNQCTELGGRVIVGLNADISVKKLKGDSRPIQHQDDRALILASLASVDAVVIFDEETPKNLIETISPDILVKGGDYDLKSIVGAEWVQSYGGQVIIYPLLEGRSSSIMLTKIVSL